MLNWAFSSTRGIRTIRGWRERVVVICLVIPLAVASCAAVPESKDTSFSEAVPPEQSLAPMAYYHFLRGYLAELAENFPKALEQYRAGLQFDPDSTFLRFQMASLYFISGNLQKAVDLLGQIASEDRFGGHMINGTGGQPDTHLAASLCPDGRAITVLRSTALNGTTSKIVAKHESGTLITIPRYLADTIVTEYGVAQLLDKNHRQRAEELISIAHPDFRGELRKQASELWGL